MKKISTGNRSTQNPETDNRTILCYSAQKNRLLFDLSSQKVL